MKQYTIRFVHPRIFLVAALLACSACTAFVAQNRPLSSLAGGSGATLAAVSAHSSRAPLISELPVVFLMQRGVSGLEVKGIGLSLSAAGRIVTAAMFDASHPLFVARVVEQQPGYRCDSLVQIVSQDAKRGIALLQTVAPVADDCSQGSFVGEWQPLPAGLPSSLFAGSGSDVQVMVPAGGQIRKMAGRLTGSGDQLQISLPVSSIPSGIVLNAIFEPLGLVLAKNGSGSSVTPPVLSLSGLSRFIGLPAAGSSLPAAQ